MSTPAGQYHTRITIQRLKKTATVNAAGQIDETVASNWETHCQRWASIKWARGSERPVGDQVQSVGAASVEVRSDSETRALDAGMRLKIAGSDVIYWIAEPPVDIGNRREAVELTIKRSAP